MKSEPRDLAVVVISVGACQQLAGAVRSLLALSEPLEIIVVNSGGGDAGALLAREGLDVPVVEIPALLTPGAARNLGVGRTRAQYVAFLAEDCLAAPGWATVRLELHRAGHLAVGSALLNNRSRNPVAWAAHLYLFYRRLPGTPARKALVYGASYHRSLFELRGLFREDLRTGEDTEFHRRLGSADKPVWTPSVQTYHRTPGRVSDLIRDHRDRGRRFIKAHRELNSAPSRKARIAIRVFAAALPRMVQGFLWSKWPDRIYIAFALPFILLGAAAYAFGILNSSGDSESR